MEEDRHFDDVGHTLRRHDAQYFLRIATLAQDDRVAHEDRQQQQEQLRHDPLVVAGR